ncbi:MAG: 3-phosphoshikimate 1-carboxyvinyltransferase [Neisseriaceae bacterium]
MDDFALFLPPTGLRPGTISLPGSKSITNRSLLLAALSDNTCHLHNALCSDDTRYLKQALINLAIPIEEIKPDEILIQGKGGQFPATAPALYLGNAGTAFRPLTAILALQQGQYRLCGNTRMHERPIHDLVEALRQVGARINYTGEVGYPPLTIEAFCDNHISKIFVHGKISSQYLSALLIALPILRREISIEVVGELISKPYVSLTLDLIEKFGVFIQTDRLQSFFISKSQSYHAPEHYMIESDASSASYFLAAAYLTGVPLTLKGIGKNSIQGDLQLIYELAKLGANYQFKEDSVTLSRAPEQPVPAFTIEANSIPDAAMVFCILALVARGRSTITGIASWKVKETDRIEAMKTELQKLGAEVTTTGSSIQITPPYRLKPNVGIDTYDDHRMAMCFSLISLLGVPVTINGASCVNKTFPEYFTIFNSLKQT